MQAKIGQLALEKIFWKARSSRRAAERKAMIDPAHELSITRQAALLGISRAAVYYEPQPIPGMAVCRRQDAQEAALPQGL